MCVNCSGIVPVRELEARDRFCNCCRALNWGGIAPDNKLEGKYNVTRRVKDDSETGKGPVNWLLLSCSLQRSTSVLSCCGTGPLKSLESNSKAVNLTKVDRDNGRWPVKKLLVIRSICNALMRDISEEIVPFKSRCTSSMLVRDVRANKSGSRTPMEILWSDRETTIDCVLQITPDMLQASSLLELLQDASCTGEPQWPQTVLKICVSWFVAESVHKDGWGSGISWCLHIGVFDFNLCGSVKAWIFSDKCTSAEKSKAWLYISKFEVVG